MLSTIISTQIFLLKIVAKVIKKRKQISHLLSSACFFEQIGVKNLPLQPASLADMSASALQSYGAQVHALTNYIWAGNVNLCLNIIGLYSVVAEQCTCDHPCEMTCLH